MHIPHRIRVGIALLEGMEKSFLGAKVIIAPQCRSKKRKLYWRIVTNSVFEGRLVATRWLIEFVGVKQGSNGEPCKRQKNPKFPADVRIDDLAGGELLDFRTTNGKCLADIWQGCSQASVHATHKSGHPSVSDSQIANALTIITGHLQETVYKEASLDVRDYVFGPLG